MTDTSRYDIVIAGGGMIGTSLALALRPLKARVAVIEAVPRAASAQPSFDDRSTALSRSTQRMLEALGLWDDVRKASTPIDRIHVSEKGRFGFSHIDAEEQGVEALGHVVINRVLGQVLDTALGNLAGTQWITPARVVATRLEGDTRIVTIDDGESARDVSCQLLIVADGARSAVRELVGIGARFKDYRQTAVIGNLVPGKPIANTAYERFTDSGPLAMLPVTDSRAAFVWILQRETAAEVMEMDDDDFLQELHERFGNRLGEFSRVGKRATYPLYLSQANCLVAERAVLVGNAAHGLHPVAAQGFNLGMRDVATLCDCLHDHAMTLAEAGETSDFGDPGMLERYANWRRSDQRKLVGFTDGLVRLFADSRKSIALLRNVGMLGFDLIPGVRRMFARHTMGLEGKLPRLSRGVPLR